MIKRDVCILIAAYNEEKVIGKTLEGLTQILQKKDIYIINDGSVDKTAKIAKTYTHNVLSIPNKGKGGALNEGIKYFNLTRKYKYIAPSDADSILDPKFFDKIIERFENDKEKKIVGIAGKVVGHDRNWLTSYRLWEYEITQLIHKEAQSIINSITVCPGPCSVFRSELFNKIKYPKGTVTEDMDLTFLIHRKKLGVIVHEPSSLAHTQDPDDLITYVKQLNRWYTGFWQCVMKYNIPKGKQVFDIEVALLATEGIFSGLLTLSIPLLLVLMVFNNYMILLFGFVIDFSIFVLPSTAYVAYKHNSIKLFGYIPHFYFARLLSSLIFLNNYGIVVRGKDKKLSQSWDMPRYA